MSIEQLYADKVVANCSPLTGEPAAEISEAELVARWRSTLSGFDRTRHTLSDRYADVESDWAVVEADFVADHYLGARFWQARDAYRFELQRIDGRWRIVTHAMKLRGENGTRDILLIAQRRGMQGDDRHR